MRNIYSTTDNISKIPTVVVFKSKFLTLCSNFTMIQQLTNLGSLFYRDRFECIQKKKEGFEKEKKKNEFERERE